MIVYAIALYLVPALLALAASVIGAAGLRFYWREVRRED